MLADTENRTEKRGSHTKERDEPACWEDQKRDPETEKTREWSGGGGECESENFIISHLYYIEDPT